VLNIISLIYLNSFDIHLVYSNIGCILHVFLKACNMIICGN